MWYLGATYDPTILKLGKIIHILIKRVHVKFHGGNIIFRPVIIAKHIS